MKRTRLKPNWTNIAALAVISVSIWLGTWGWLDVAADKVCAL